MAVIWIYVQWHNDFDNQHCMSSVLISHTLTCQAKIVDSNIHLEQQLAKFWEMESLEKYTPITNPYETFQEELKYRNTEQQYKVCLPLKEYSEILPIIMYIVNSF